MPSNLYNSLERVTQAYEWFNQVGRRDIPLDRNVMAEYFAADVVMKVDNVIKAEAFEGLHHRFTEMLERTSRWEAAVLTPALCDGIRAAAYCQFRFLDLQGRVGLVHACSIWTLRGQRIREIVEVASFESVRLELANHR